VRIPQDATPDVRQAIREVWEELDRLLTKNIDLRGRRLMNAGPSVDARDYVTRAELTGYVAPPVAVSSGGGGFSGDVEDGTGKIARLDGSGTFSGSRTVSGTWNFTSQVTVTSSNFPVLRTVRTSLTTNVERAVADFVHRTSGNMTDNFAASIRLAIEDDAGLVNSIVGMAGARAGADNTGRLHLQTATGGTFGNRLSLDGTSAAFSVPVSISAAAPSITFTDSGGDDYSIRCTADAIYIRNVTDAVDVAWFFGGGLGTLNVGISGTDPGAGEANVRILTRATDTPTSGYNWDGTGNAPDGYFKEYNGTQAVVIPFWNT
jgi:hypothetical protein